MLNIFINSTTYGQAMGATFKMDVEGTLGDKRITVLENCDVIAPVYERIMDVDKVTALISSGQTQKVSNLGKAVEVENIRVNSLSMLLRELELVSSLDDSEMLVAYVPVELLQEIETGRVKYYLDGETETTYYSEAELALWGKFMDIVPSLYHRLIFNSITKCKVNKSNTQLQADKVGIYNSMQNKLLVAYREMKILKTGVVNAPAQAIGDAF